MSKYNLEVMRKKLKKDLDNYRYHHTLGVMYTAASLAMCYGMDIIQAQTAGLLHDCAKCYTDEEQLALCHKYNIQVTEAEQKSPYLLHAKLGAYFAGKNYGIRDQEILGAIRYHTTGRPGMTDLEKIIYLADYIEPMRDKASNLKRIRRLAFTSLDEAMYAVLKDTLYYLGNSSKSVDPVTQEAYDYYAAIPGIADGPAGQEMNL